MLNAKAIAIVAGVSIVISFGLALLVAVFASVLNIDVETAFLQWAIFIFIISLIVYPLTGMLLRYAMPLTQQQLISSIVIGFGITAVVGYAFDLLTPSEVSFITAQQFIGYIIGGGVIYFVARRWIVPNQPIRLGYWIEEEAGRVEAYWEPDTKEIITRSRLGRQVLEVADTEGLALLKFRDITRNHTHSIRHR